MTAVKVSLAAIAGSQRVTVDVTCDAGTRGALRGQRVAACITAIISSQDRYPVDDIRLQIVENRLMAQHRDLAIDLCKGLRMRFRYRDSLFTIDRSDEEAIKFVSTPQARREDRGPRLIAVQISRLWQRARESREPRDGEK